jgi:hypothetical protein
VTKLENEKFTSFHFEIRHKPLPLVPRYAGFGCELLHVECVILSIYYIHIIHVVASIVNSFPSPLHNVGQSVDVKETKNELTTEKKIELRYIEQRK